MTAAAEAAVVVVVTPVPMPPEPVESPAMPAPAQPAAAAPAAPAAPPLDLPLPPLPPAADTMRETIVGTAWSDLRRAAWLLMLGVTVLSAYHTVRLRYFDPCDFYAYQGTEGPFEVLTDDQGHTDPGPALTVAHAGQAFGWIVNFCMNEGVSISYDFDLVRLAQAGFPEAVVAHKDGSLTPASRRCGPRLNVWSIPPGALPGEYEVRRRVVLRAGTWFPIIQSFTPVSLAVLPVPAPGPAATPAPDRSAYKRIDL